MSYHLHPPAAVIQPVASWLPTESLPASGRWNKNPGGGGGPPGAAGQARQITVIHSLPALAFMPIMQSTCAQQGHEDASAASIAAEAVAVTWQYCDYCCLLVACGGDAANPAGPTLHAPEDPGFLYRGVNLDISGRPTASHYDELAADGVSWIALIPFGWQTRFDEPAVRLRTSGVRWSETDAGLREIGAEARARGIGVLLKPHVWLTEEVAGEWRGTIRFDSEQEWQQWESDYRTLILHYAALASEEEMDLFSVGVECTRPSAAGPPFGGPDCRCAGDPSGQADLWRQLVRGIRGCDILGSTGRHWRARLLPAREAVRGTSTGLQRMMCRSSSRSSSRPPDSPFFAVMTTYASTAEKALNSRYHYSGSPSLS